MSIITSKTYEKPNRFGETYENPNRFGEKVGINGISVHMKMDH